MQSPRSPVYVTQPYLPPLEEFIPYLEQIWKNKWLTNAGPFHAELEAALADHLEISHLSLFANGTIALLREWTDQAPPSTYTSVLEQPPILHAACLIKLLDLVQLINKKVDDAK